MKIAIVTGASSGLGQEYVRVIAEKYEDIEEMTNEYAYNIINVLIKYDAKNWENCEYCSKLFYNRTTIEQCAINAQLNHIKHIIEKEIYSLGTI